METQYRLINIVNDNYMVIEIDANGLGLVDSNNPDDLASYIYLEYENIKPVTLTEEWLLKFGFELNDGEYAIEYNRFNLSKPNNYYGYLLSDGLKGIKPILYVHELQNIYFYLTNKELCIQEK